MLTFLVAFVNFCKISLPPVRKVEYPPPLQELIRPTSSDAGYRPSQRRADCSLDHSSAPTLDRERLAKPSAGAAKPCSTAANAVFFSEGERCAICNDPARDRSVLCVVEQPTDILALERTGSFNGVYHALGGKLSPLNHVGPERPAFRSTAAKNQTSGSE